MSTFEKVQEKKKNKGYVKYQLVTREKEGVCLCVREKKEKEGFIKCFNLRKKRIQWI